MSNFRFIVNMVIVIIASAIFWRMFMIMVEKLHLDFVGWITGFVGWIKKVYRKKRGL